MATREIFAAAAAARLEERRQREAKEAGKGNKEPERRGSMRALFGIFPLLVIPVAIYNIIALTGGGPVEAVPGEAGPLISPLIATLNNTMLNVPMISGVTWQLSSGDLLILLAMVLLFLEILKSTSTGTATIMNHAVSMILFIVCLIEFLLFANFATSVFFILTVMTLLDVLAGVVVTIVSARRDFAVGEGFSG